MDLPPPLSSFFGGPRPRSPFRSHHLIQLQTHTPWPSSATHSRAEERQTQTSTNTQNHPQSGTLNQSIPPPCQLESSQEEQRSMPSEEEVEVRLFGQTRPQLRPSQSSQPYIVTDSPCTRGPQLP